MKNKILTIMGAWLLMLGFSSCHEQSDTLMTYDHTDELVFGDATRSYAAQFKVLWNAMNQNYALWDYEKENGLDWDAVYNEYLPQFEELDKKEEVTDKELKELLTKVLSPLHDGHMLVAIKNPKTDNNVYIAPSEIRNKERDDYKVADLRPNLKYYINKKNGEIEIDKEGDPIYMEYSTRVDVLLDKVKNTPGQGLRWVNDSINVLASLPLPSLQQVKMLQLLIALETALQNIDASEQGLQEYNALVNQYASLDIPGLTPISPKFIDNGMSARFALLKDNIAYLYISSFSLSPYINDEYRNYIFAGVDNYAADHIMMIKKVWECWYETIQLLHSIGLLKGVIIDVRGNGGGMMSDFYYVMGALLPSGGFQCTQMRFKRGTGRLDYSPLIPYVYNTIETEHAVVTEPIVVLANCRSVSMSEATALSTKYIDNACLIGKRTWGGLCSLSDNPSFSYNYSGHIGVEDQTPVYVYLPTVACFNREGEQLEGIGITPDIEVNLDEKLFKSNGKDTQLDRALQYIRTGK